MSNKNDGPTVTVIVSCFECVHELSEKYRVQGDSGHDVFCTHGPVKKSVGDTVWHTPDWCPLIPSFVAEYQSMLLQREKGKGDE